MSVDIHRTSRLRFGTLVTVNNVEFWDILDLPDFPHQDGDVSYTVQTGDRIDRIAATYYGNPVLWWVLAVANDLELLPTDLTAGDTIRIPSPVYVSQRLFQKAQVQ